MILIAELLNNHLTYAVSDVQIEDSGDIGCAMRTPQQFLKSLKRFEVLVGLYPVRMIFYFNKNLL